MEANYIERNTSAAISLSGRIKRNSNTIIRSSISGILVAVILISALTTAYFTAYAEYFYNNDIKYDNLNFTIAESSVQAADRYFSAFGECDSEKYLALMTPAEKAEQSKLFDSEKELYESYASQFEDEREFFTALYGSDFIFSYEIMSSSKFKIDSYHAETFNVKSEVKGRKAQRTIDGKLTVIEIENGWYIYDTDFEEIFW